MLSQKTWTRLVISIYAPPHRVHVLIVQCYDDVCKMSGYARTIGDKKMYDLFEQFMGYEMFQAWLGFIFELGNKLDFPTLSPLDNSVTRFVSFWNLKLALSKQVDY